MQTYSQINTPGLMGFKSINDFTKTVTGYIYIKIILFCSLFFGALFFCAENATAFINGWIFTPGKVLVLVWFVIFLDWLSAAYPAAKAGKFQTEKAKRLVPVLVANTLVLSTLFWIEKIMLPALDMPILDASFKIFRIFSAAYITSVAFISAVSNAGRNDLIHNGFVDFVTKYVDAQKRKFEEIVIDELEEVHTESKERKD